MSSTALSRDDAHYMAQALRLAERGRYTTSPNPMVGAVVVKDNEVVGSGWHRFAGQAHAEILALQQAGEHARGATVYVTLEPCAHEGRTGPCANALVAAGVKRVVYAQEDPNPLVCAKGLAILREAGIDVDGPLMESAARQLNRGFNKRMATGLPWVRIKMATSLDGRTAMPDGRAFWITGPKARADVQRVRGESCALITGRQTLIQDQARLSLRPNEFKIDDEGFAERLPLRVLVDSQASLATPHPFFKEPGAILVATTLTQSELDGAPRTDKQHSSDIEWASYPERDNHVDLHALLRDLAARGCNNILVEAGAGLAGAFFKQGLADELLIYIAPKVMGSEARGLFDLPLKIMEEALPLNFTETRSLGRDLKVTALIERE